MTGPGPLLILGLMLLLGLTACTRITRTTYCDHLLAPGYATLDGTDRVWVSSTWPIDGTAYITVDMIHDREEVHCSRLTQPKPVEAQ